MSDIFILQTLQEASMLCRVMHIALTVRTGDQSFARIEAQIYVVGTVSLCNLLACTE